VLTVYDDDERVFGALCAGAHGSLSKKTPPEGLIAAVRSVVHGGGIVSPDAARRILALLSSPTGDAPAEWTLDAADSTVLRMLAQGHNLETAADELRTPVARLAAGTRRIYDKLHRFCRLAASPP
jgi:DNA-binding NarL/FixJ family response regulator